MRLVRGSVFVACCICRPCSCTINGGTDNDPHEWRETCDRYPALSCFVDGIEDPERLRRISLYGKPIAREEYGFMVADSAWARRHAPTDPKADPATAVDIKNVPIPF